MELSRVDYTQVLGTSKRAITTMPYGDREPLIVGDSSGNLQMFNLDLIHTSAVWSQTIRPISRVHLMRRKESLRPVDTIFAASGTYIHSYSNSGRENFALDSNMTEPINSFKSLENELWITGNYLYTYLINNKEQEYANIQDEIHDLDLVFTAKGFSPVVACQDKTVRELATNAESVSSQSFSSVPLVLSPYKHTFEDWENTSELICALGSGGISCIDFNQGSQVLWSISHEAREPSALFLYDITGNGINDLIVGRSDGKVEVFTEENGKYSIAEEQKLPEGVTSVVAGRPRGKAEVVLSTFSGKILGLGSPDLPVISGSVSESLQQEISVLQKQLEETKLMPGEVKQQSSARRVSSRLTLLGEEAAYLLVLDSQDPIDMILLQSEIELDIISPEDSPATINLIEDGSQLLVTFKFPDTSFNNIEIKFRANEGQNAEIDLYVIPETNNKVATKVTVELKPLSLHEKISNINEHEYILNVLEVSGNFTKNEMHGWVAETLPGVPPSSEEESLSLCYTSCVLGTVLISTYSNNWAQFKSESASILAIIKESINKHASFRKIHLEIEFVENPESVVYVLELIDEELSELEQLETEVELIDALKEIEIEADLEKFPADFREILEDEDRIKEECLKKPKKLQFLQGLVTDLYVDLCKFRNIPNVSVKIPELQHILSQYSLDNLITFFRAYVMYINFDE